MTNLNKHYQQNVSRASSESQDETNLNYFPTPPWATRALLKHVLNPWMLKGASAWEPACGDHAMSHVLKEAFDVVYTSDIHRYQYYERWGNPDVFKQLDFLSPEGFVVGQEWQPDWVITNPPFNKAEEFIKRGLEVGQVGVAMLLRTQFLETIGRYNRLFKDKPPHVVAMFSQRPVMLKGRLEKSGSTMTSYSWLVWYTPTCGKSNTYYTKMIWIPPCKGELTKIDDYPYYHGEKTPDLEQSNTLENM